MDKVYWIRNVECADILKDGYIGVSQDPLRRFKQHLKRNPKIPKDAWVEVIFEGSREECFAKEEELRPVKNTGWNRAVGGIQGFKRGFSHSEETKIKLKNAWTDDRRAKASTLKTELNAKLKGQKRPKQSVSISGSKNPMFGKPRSDDVKQKLREANLGRSAPNRQELFCVGCHERASNHVLKRHSKCWKNYKDKR